jgi:hypothetical protein
MPDLRMGDEIDGRFYSAGSDNAGVDMSVLLGLSGDTNLSWHDVSNPVGAEGIWR